MSDLPYGPFGFPNVRAWGMAPPLNVQDDLDASATPMAVEPAVRPKRKKAPATDQGVAAFQAVLEDVGGDYAQAISVFAGELAQGGVAPELAQQAAMARAKQHQSLSRDPGIFFEEMGTPLPTTRQPKAPQVGASQPVPFGAMPDADPRTTRAERLAGVDATAAKWDRQKAAYDRATGLGAPDAVEDFVPPAAGGNRLPARSGPYDLAGRPGYDRTFTPQELAAQRGDDESPAPASFTLPGPRTLDGKPVRPPRALATQEDAARYKERGTDPETGRRTKSQYDLDMEARGYTAVMEPDGSVSYRTTYAPATDEPTGLGAIGRAGRRVDLEKSKVPGTEDSRYEPRPMMTPTGEMVQVWVPTDAGDAYTAQQAEQRTKNRLADRAGLGAEAEGMTADELRSAVRAKRTSEKQDRESAWRAQMMLGGGRPTGGPMGTKAAAAAFSRLTPEQQQEVIKNRMLYGERNGQRGDEWDRRLDLMRIENEARFKEAEAARSEARDEREKDRTLTREERQAAREADERRFAEERATRELEWRERSKQFDLQQLEGQRRFEQQNTGLAAQLAQIQNQGEVSRGELELARGKQDAALTAAENAQRLAEQSRREQEAVGMYGPGAVHILRGNLQHPSAQAAFRGMAARADQTWNGFFTEDAARLDAMLVSLGITDPDRRRAIVQEYGINSDFPGQQGRGSVLSAWRVSHPDYASVPQ